MSIWWARDDEWHGYQAGGGRRCVGFVHRSVVFASMPALAKRMSSALCDLPPFDDNGGLRVVVESPKSSTIKFAYDKELGAFSISRSLPLGISYPYDWGFVPGTVAADGDPVDALVIHDASTFPGIVLTCRVLGMVRVRQDDNEGKRITNNRIIAAPRWQDARQYVRKASAIADDMKVELEQFFLSTTFFTGKNLKILGWEAGSRVRSFVAKHRR